MSNTITVAQLRSDLSEIWSEMTKSEWSKVKKDDLLWLAEVATHLPSQGRGMSETLSRYRASYETTISYSGRKSLSNGDAIAQFLEMVAPDAVMTQAERILGLEAGFLTEKYQNLNEGQKRMNSGNRLRAALKRGDITPVDLVH